MTKNQGGGVYFRCKIEKGKSVERQGRKATGPEAHNEYGCQLHRSEEYITTVGQAKACPFIMAEAALEQQITYLRRVKK